MPRPERFNIREAEVLSALTQRRRFFEPSEQEVLAQVISSRVDDARLYSSFAERLRKDYPASGAMLNSMAMEKTAFASA